MSNIFHLEVMTPAVSYVKYIVSAAFNESTQLRILCINNNCKLFTANAKIDLVLKGVLQITFVQRKYFNLGAYL